ncbi:CaiF/GrlA family transcriptional regulator [Salmonella enterica subsp. enterica serovar Enteritidis]|uniref:CaiF/GrlA family transcriptional regulator n=1 Tax=Salmonella enterica TaxID=28901 RepID=UPI00193E856B|nr:CaiF/GrlA family transcriptional regulator [Salmonella enterica]EBK2664767.1 CaiF/GrlA family transcriptional regulator [Salmonella enterica subsp. enterica serovar Enteritidis]EEH4116808.1 CaiF/GrlA family transcriptional regulator [Salmonella enterica subsp. enterica serovar Hvittingfoss]EEN5589769.1 CaiF/GrlA family transcriptional regulator [Salmonella enterica subsp. enterica serovar Mountpleasant]EIO3280158.1 CaiF/GrlA family transcriptional regulator [Salmonella enterica]
MDNTPQTYATPPLQQKKTAQSNHDPFVIPASLQQYADEPLYILIALWCLQQNDWISRMAISEAFGITDRRASFQMSYISRHKKRVDCEIRVIRTDNSQRFYHEIRVTGVVLSGDTVRAVPAQPKKSPLKRSRVGNATPELRNMLHSLMGSRRVCED